MQRLMVYSAEELINLVKKHGTVMISPSGIHKDFQTSYIVTGVYKITKYSCIFKLLKFTIDKSKEYYEVSLNPDNFHQHYVYIPDDDKRFETLPYCEFSKLEKVIIYSITLHRNVSLDFFSRHLYLTTHQYQDLLIMVEVNREEQF